MLFPFAFQRDAAIRGIVDSDTELLSGVGAVFVFPKAAVLRIVKVDASDAVCSCCRRMGIRRTNVAYSCEDQLKLSLGADVFQLVPIMSVLGNIRME